MKIVKIPVAGMIEIKDIPHTLEALQKEVGGYIEITRPNLPDGFVMVVDEEGLIKEKPVNTQASLIYGGVIAGDVFIVREKDGDFVDIDDFHLEAILKHIFKLLQRGLGGYGR